MMALWNGFSIGMLLFLLSSGFTLIFSLLGVLNFAHAAFYMLGAYLAFSLSAHISYPVALVVAPLLVAALGGFFEWFILRRIHAQGHVAELMMTFGLSLVMVELVQLVWGLGPLDFVLPPWANDSIALSQGVQVSAHRLFAMLVSGLVLVLLWLFVKHSIWGLQIRAALSHPMMLSAMGFRVSVIFTLVFALGAGLAGLAGVLAAGIQIVEPGMAASVGPLIFVVVVIGGLGSLGGAFVASIGIGLLQSTAILSGGWLAQWASALPYAVLLLFLLIRPHGLWGKRLT
jgi:branched-chain amino acid transport system permease protein